MATDVAICMYHTGLDPFLKKPGKIAKNLNDRKLLRTVMQFSKRANYFEVRAALMGAAKT
jgi:hypothetical protein